MTDNVATVKEVKNSPAESVTPITDGWPVHLLKRCIDSVGKWSSIASGFYVRQDYSPDRQTVQHRRAQMRRVDVMLMIWWFIPLLCYSVIASWQGRWFAYLALVPVILRIANITFYNLRVAVVETDEVPGGEPIHIIISGKRSLVLGMVNFVELIICFACIYAAFPHCLIYSPEQARDSITFLYFSCMTQLTVGYGDVAPLKWLRPVACVQGLGGLFLITLTIGRFISLIQFEEVRNKKSSS